QALARLGHDVRMTGNAATLWRWVADGEGDLVITDVIMPDENGLDLIPRIKKMRPELRVIVMSAQSTLLTAVKATERGAFARIAVDIRPLRESRDFRRLWFGTGVSAIGSQITTVAIPFQVYQLTHSTLAIAALTGVQLVPLLALSLVAGSLADAVDRRRLLLVTQALLAVTSIALALIALQPAPSLALIMIVAMVGASLGAITQPARASA
ncbi:MAG: MFS transporter, partial [Chthoniobacterales bacterium]